MDVEAINIQHTKSIERLYVDDEQSLHVAVKQYSMYITYDTAEI